MNPSVFVDTDIVLDLLAKRDPFFPFAAELFTKADRKEINLFVSSLCFSNLNYIVSRQKTAAEARKLLATLKVLVTVLPVDDKIIELALHSRFKDFEDAIQYHCALEHDIRILVTRNIRDYKQARISVLTAEQFLINFG
jgi:predicted nucleic acid-binding protein